MLTFTGNDSTPRETVLCPLYVLTQSSQPYHLLLSLFDPWGNQGILWLSSLLKVTRLIRVRTRSSNPEPILLTMTMLFSLMFIRLILKVLMEMCQVKDYMGEVLFFYVESSASPCHCWPLISPPCLQLSKHFSC